MAGKEEALIDERRRRWIPLSVEFPFDKTGTRLQEEFGPAGLGVWVAMLTAAKRAHIQGTFSYTTEEEAWATLGIHSPPFPLADFIAVTGRIKKTRKRRRGRITDVQITAWEEWNDTLKTRPRDLKDTKSDAKDTQKTQKVTDKTPGQSTRLVTTERDSDTESEREIEIDESNPFFKFLKKKGLV
jgi:hypothetical protein